MTMNIADNLKRLRKQKNITQEDLAGFIGVSFQAVSKWERGDGYPDITILPVIANFFDVTIDELVGMNEIKNTARLERIFAQLKENASQGKIDENILLLREEIKHFPNNYKLLLELAEFLTTHGVDNDTKKKNNLESMQICRRILEFCTDSTIRVTAQKLICLNYSWNEDNENAAKEARNLPGIWDCKEVTRPTFLIGNELACAAQNTIAQIADVIQLQINLLADANYSKGLNWTHDERIAILDKGNQILNIIYENGDYHFFNIRLSTTYRAMAALSLLRVC
jgi:transcriptional regulator with XRE-family HTH domain